MGLAERIQKHIPEEGPVVILPADEATMNLYYILNCRPLDYLFHNYPWFMEEKVIQRWLASMKSDRSVAVIFFPGRWALDRYAPEMVAYVKGHCSLVKTIPWEGAQVEIRVCPPE